VNEDFEILSEIVSVETIASGLAVQKRRLLSKVYGAGHWRKLKGIATIRLPDGVIVRAELHWFEAHGRGRRDLKVKRILKPTP